MQVLANRGAQGPAPNEIWYWAASQVTLYSSANVVSHAFADGKGVVTYDYAIEQVPWAFRGTAITAVQVPGTATSIGSNAFYQCYSLSSAILPDSITSIGQNAFWNAPLALASLPSALVSIDNNAFRACPLTVSELPPNLETVGQNTFYGCSGMSFTVIPATVSSLGIRAFQSCTGLRELTFLGTPSSIDATAFQGCTNLTAIRVPWAEGAVANAPWGASLATITYNYTPQ